MSAGTAGHEEWLGGVRTGLLRSPSKEALFRLTGDGWPIPGLEAGGPKARQRLVRLAFASTRPAGSHDAIEGALVAVHGT